VAIPLHGDAGGPPANQRLNFLDDCDNPRLAAIGGLAGSPAAGRGAGVADEFTAPAREWRWQHHHGPAV